MEKVVINTKIHSIEEAKDWIRGNERTKRKYNQFGEVELIGRTYNEHKQPRGGARKANSGSPKLVTAKDYGLIFGVGKDKVIESGQCVEAMDKIVEALGTEGKQWLLNLYHDHESPSKYPKTHLIKMRKLSKSEILSVLKLMDEKDIDLASAIDKEKPPKKKQQRKDPPTPPDDQLKPSDQKSESKDGTPPEKPPSESPLPPNGPDKPSGKTAPAQETNGDAKWKKDTSSGVSKKTGLSLAVEPYLTILVEINAIAEEIMKVTPPEMVDETDETVWKKQIQKFANRADTRKRYEEVRELAADIIIYAELILNTSGLKLDNNNPIR